MFLLTLNLWLSFAFALEKIQSVDLFTEKSVEISFSKPQKATVLIFMSAKCPCSQSHEPTVKKLSDEYTKKGFVFYAVHSNTDEPIDLAQKHFKDLFSFQVLQDSKAALADQFKAFKTPHVFILDSSGNVVYQGGVDDSTCSPDSQKHFLQEVLQALDEGKPSPYSSARALGCVIRR